MDTSVLSNLHDKYDLAALLEIPLPKLTYILYRSSPNHRYREFQIPKRSGNKRTILAPRGGIGRLQHALKSHLVDLYKVRPSAHGFVRDRSILTNAAHHTRKRFVLNVDIDGFFDAINFGRVRGMLIAKPHCVPEDVATLIAQLCCHQGRLPQGAPTSPAISNLICRRLDGELQQLAKRHHCLYTRYADDLTFSTNRPTFPEELAQRSSGASHATTILGKDLVAIVTQNGFAVKDAKTRLAGPGMSKTVTGLTVSYRVNVKRRYVRQIRAMIFAWRKHGLEAAEKEHYERFRAGKKTPSHRDFSAVLAGKLEFLRHVRGASDPLYRKYARQLQELMPGYRRGEVFGMTDSDERKRDVFLCHASEDKKSVVDPLARSLRSIDVSVWYDKNEIGWGDDVVDRINEGLQYARVVVVVLSHASAEKRWPQREMSAALNREISNGSPRVIALLVGDLQTRDRILRRLPLLEAKNYRVWEKDPAAVAAEIKLLLNRSQLDSSEGDDTTGTRPERGALARIRRILSLVPWH